MLTFNLTMDPHSLEVMTHRSVAGRDGTTLIGHLMWHPSRSPRFCPCGTHFDADGMHHLTLFELQELTQRLEAEVNKAQKESDARWARAMGNDE